MRHDTYRVKSY